MKPECEQYQINLSTMLDGELKGMELADTVKHLTECGDCRRQFEVFHKMQEKVEAEYTVKEVPSYIWRNLEKTAAAEKSQPLVVPFTRTIWKIAAAAAVIAVVFGIGYFFGQPGNVLTQDGEPLIKLTGYQQKMNEDEFLELTRELLNADPKYQMKMYMVLHTIYDNNIEGGMEQMMLEGESDRVTEGKSEKNRKNSPEMRF